jgi:cytochrome c5
MHSARFFPAVLALCCSFVLCAAAQAADSLQNADAAATYVGSAACQQCHDQEYDNFAKYSKKAHSRQNVEKMSAKLTREELEGCYACHTTGYGKKGGFVDYGTTPQLGDVGCETCHGPGSVHAESGDTSAITRKPSVDSCLVCHNAERIQNFNFRPLRYSGAH